MPIHTCTPVNNNIDQIGSRLILGKGIIVFHYQLIEFDHTSVEAWFYYSTNSSGTRELCNCTTAV